MSGKEPVRGRGAADNPPNRFVPIAVEPDPDAPADERQAPQTKFFIDASKTAIAYNDSPDVGFSASLNPYRGCEHGCVYCFARPTHEYYGLSLGLDFETKIMVKQAAPELLRKELAAKSWKPQVIMMSGVTDCYQPVERKLGLTRRCLEVLNEFRNPVGIVTKNHLVTRDADILAEMAKRNTAAVTVSVTTLDAELARVMEPRTSTPSRRLAAIGHLAAAGVPVNVNVAPVIPGLNDHEIPAIIAAAAKAGATSAAYVLLRLPFGVKELFEGWLDKNFPDRKKKVLSQIRSQRKGDLYDATWGRRMTGEGPFAEEIAALFKLACKRAGFKDDLPDLSTEHFRRPAPNQLELFG